MGLTYCTDECTCEGVVAKTKQYAGLSNARISNEQEFEQQVIRLLGHCTGRSAGSLGIWWTGVQGRVNAINNSFLSESESLGEKIRMTTILTVSPRKSRLHCSQRPRARANRKLFLRTFSYPCPCPDPCLRVFLHTWSCETTV